MLYVATHYTYSPVTGPGVGETRTFGTRRTAELWAHSLLKRTPVVTTNDCYWRDLGRAPCVRMSRKDQVASETILPEVHVVPSVGELGWTP
jgi:hypothetical protein